MTSLTVFAQNMRAYGVNVQKNTVKLQKAVSLRVVELVADATPVLTGQASGNWKTSIGNVDQSWDQGPNSAVTSVANAIAVLGRLAPDQVVNIANNVPYIIDLNNGSSSKAPAAFVQTSALQAAQIANGFNLLSP